jgi:hypothetical protein
VLVAVVAVEILQLRVVQEAPVVAELEVMEVDLKMEPLVLPIQAVAVAVVRVVILH